jgi:hypothetical protein
MNMHEYLATDYLAGDVRVAPTKQQQAEASDVANRLRAASAASAEAFETEVDLIARALLEPIGLHCLACPEGDESASRIAAVLEALFEPTLRELLSDAP